MAVGLQALEESIAQEKNQLQEALETTQARVHELENQLACQKEVRPAAGGWLKGLQEAEDRRAEGGRSSVLFVLAWTLQLGEA